MLKKILLILVLLIVTFLLVAALQPGDFRYERSATINAPADKVFAQVNNFQNWNAWSPWAKLDPNAKNTFEGPEAGVGAVFKWEGNNEVGAGIMTITETKPNELIIMKLEFLKPMPGVNTTEFTFKPEGNATKVTWAMYGKCDFLCKSISLVMNCEKMVGEMFDKGLANIKTITEGASTAN